MFGKRLTFALMIINITFDVAVACLKKSAKKKHIFTIILVIRV